MSNFITNSTTKQLKQRLLELFSKSKELKFLVGFFYFSGLKELYEGLKNNPDINLNILVGLNVDKTNYGLLEHADKRKNISDEEKIYDYFQSIVKSINNEIFDNKEFYIQVHFFLELINKDKIIIRKTSEPNHAKLYIFKLEEDQVGRNTLFITGSSNLTSAGLTKQNEFNVEISDYGFEETEKYFDDLWHTAIPITEDKTVKKKIIDIIKKETLIKEITPFEAYILVLKIYLDTFEGQTISQRLIEILNENGYKVYDYQLDAVKQSKLIIEENNGVIIADVVGLGKTVIACAAAYELKKRGIVIAPPSLIGDKSKKSGWKKYLEEFHLTSLGWDAYSLGDLETATEVVSKAKDIDVIIIDEAHRFRNQDTKNYELLKNICRGKIVILLTATPFNNKPGDIFSLLKLFITPKKSNITLGNDIEFKFRIFRSTFDKLAYIKKYIFSLDSKKRIRALNYYKSLFGDNNINLDKVKKLSNFLAKEIRDVIEPVTIRRNRLDLQENPYYKEEVKDLSKVEDPKEWLYELTESQSKFYDKVINQYFALPEDNGLFKGAIYRPFFYEVKEKDKLKMEENFQYITQLNLYDFMRRLLVKRFESSFGSFRQSLINFRKITKIVEDFITKTQKYILDRSLLEKIYEKDPEEIEEHLKEYAEKIRKNEYPKNHKIYKVDKFYKKEQFLKDIKSDLELFDNILKELDKLNLVYRDPKTLCLIKNMKKVISQKSSGKEPKRKVIIFSEYTDTVKYLEPVLLESFKDRVLVISGNITPAKITEIYKNFDASYLEQENKYDILLSSDRISEGFNLNRAGMVINYDIPWNPVRVIQRVGRINRISKKVFNKLYIVNFFPTEKGADLVKSREIASNKMFLIHNTLGEDAKIFDIDEELSPAGLYRKIQQNPEKSEKESFYTKILKEFDKLKKEEPNIIENIKNFPPRIKVSKKSTENELFVIIKKGRLFILHNKYQENNNINPETKRFEDIHENIKSKKEDVSLSLSPYFWDNYEVMKNFNEKKEAYYKEQSLQQKSINNLNTLIRLTGHEILTPYKKFIRTLLEDILDYGTLSDYTLRRIVNINTKKIEKAVGDLERLKKELGEDYLYKEKNRLKRFQQEIIISIENQK